MTREYPASRRGRERLAQQDRRCRFLTYHRVWDVRRPALSLAATGLRVDSTVGSAGFRRRFARHDGDEP